MLDRIRTAFTRTTTPTVYTPEDLQKIGQALSASRRRLAEIRQLPIEVIDLLYRETNGR